MVPALHFDEATFTPEALAEQAARAAGGFAALGVGEGDVIALMLRNEPAAIVAMLAARNLGAYWCGLNWHFLAEEARWVLEDSAAKLLVIHADLLPQIEAALPDGIAVLVVQPKPLTKGQFAVGDAAARVPEGRTEWSIWLAAQPRFSEPERRPRGFMAYTSGTTGRPKGVRRFAPAAQEAEQQRAAMASVSHTVFGVDGGSRCLLSAPMYHSAPASYAAFCAQQGATLRLEPRFDAERTLALIERDRITHLYLVPTMYQRLLRLPDAVRARHDLSSVRFVASTGSPCPVAVKRAMIDWWGPVIHEAYASSETGYVTFITADEWLAHPGAAGRPVGAAEVRVVDDAGADVHTGEVGIIYARQPAYPNFTYANNDAARQAIDRAGLVTLGDVGYLDGKGYLYLCDRKSDMVISGGVNIYPAEIEAVLSALPGVADCAVFGVPDEEWGEAIMAVVELVPDAIVDANAVRQFVRERLAGYKVPKRVEFHARLPREDSGKIMKRKLRDPHWVASGRRI